MSTKGKRSKKGIKGKLLKTKKTGRTFISQLHEKLSRLVRLSNIPSSFRCLRLMLFCFGKAVLNVFPGFFSEGKKKKK